MRRSHSLHPNQLPPLLTKFVQLVFDRLSIELAGQKFSLNSKRNDLVFPFIHIALKKLFLPNCLVSCDHISRRSMPLFRAKAVLDELIAGFPPRSPSHRSTSSGRSTA